MAWPRAAPSDRLTHEPDIAQAMAVDAKGGVVHAHRADHLDGHRGAQAGDGFAGLAEPSCDERGYAVCAVRGSETWDQKRCEGSPG